MRQEIDTAGEVRFAIARLWSEGISFNPVSQPIAAFRAREWGMGTGVLAGYAGAATELGAVADFVRARPDWPATLLRCTSVPPGGPVLHADLDTICDEIVDGLRARRWDAVYLSLHDVLISTRDLGADATLLRRVRAAIGPDVPLAVSFDMHGCLDPAIGGFVQILSGYRAYLDRLGDLPAVFWFFHDPGLVARAHTLVEGAAISCTFGGRVVQALGAPVPFQGRARG